MFCTLYIKNTRISVQDNEKTSRKLLTNVFFSDIITELSAEMWKTSQKVDTKKLKKSFEKVLTSGKECDILFRLSRKNENSTDLENYTTR